MDYADPVIRPNAARAIAGTLIKASLDTAIDAVSADLAGAFGGPVAARFVPRTDAKPAWGVWGVGQYLWAMAEGCSFLTHGISTASGYTGSVLSPSLYGHNAYFHQIGADIAAEIRTRPGYQTARIRFVGHSLGGAAVEAAAFQLREEVNTDACEVCTFGAPKFGDTLDCRRVSAYRHGRWFNSDDPVPLVFPTASDNLGIMLILTTPQLVRIGSFTQPFGGLEVLPSGTIRAAEFPSEAAVDAVANIGAWLLSIDREQATPHDLPEYIERFSRYLSRNVPVANTPRPSQTIAPPVDTSRNELTRRQAHVVNEMRQQEQAQHAAKRRLPAEHLVSVQRFGRLFRVVWGDQVLSVCTRKRSALKLKRTCNQFLESLLVMGVVEPETLRHQMDTFITDAVAGSGGIVPSMKVALPSDE